MVGPPAQPSQPGVNPPWTAYPGMPSSPWQPPPAMPVPLQPPPPPNAFQNWLIRTFQPSLAGNAIFGIVLGAVVALFLGGLVSILLEVLFHAIAPTFGFSPSTGRPGGQDIMDYMLGLTPLHAPFRDGLQLFYLMNGAGEHLQYTYSSSTYNITTNPALNGLLLIPALVLVLGGYIAAATDMQNRAMRSLLRGVTISIPYALLLVILTSQVKGNLPLYPGESSSDVSTLTMDTTSILILGLLWGALFGLLGASIKLARGHWRRMVVQYLGKLPRPQIVGMALGGLAATGLGLALSFLAILGLLAFSAFSISVFTNNICSNYGLADWQFMTGWGITQGLLHAANVFYYSIGAPITINNPAPLSAACFYTRSEHVSLSMFGGSPHLPGWTYALLLLPLISLFLGGRVSAAYGRAQAGGQGAVQGALVAVPFTILLMLLSVFTSISYQYSGPYTNSGTNITYIQTAGVGVADLLLWGLLSGALFGALGAAYQAGAFKLGMLVAILLAPIKALATPGYTLFDRLRGRNSGSTRTMSLTLLYAAGILAILLALVVAGTSIAFIAFNQSFPYTLNTRIRDILAVILIALPGLLLIGAAGAALSEEKLPPVHIAPPPANVPVYPGLPSHPYGGM